MPAGSRRGTSARPSPTPPPPPKPKKRRWRPRLRLGFIPLLLLLVVVYLVGVPLYFWTQIDKVDAEPGGDRPDDQPGTNYLIVGSDKADDLTRRPAQGARDRRARRHQHRHDHRAAHRLRAVAR